MVTISNFNSAAEQALIISVNAVKYGTETPYASIVVELMKGGQEVCLYHRTYIYIGSYGNS